MAKARKIRKHVMAVKNIRTITKTMEMIASARFRRAHDLATATRPYSDKLASTVAELLRAAEGDQLSHPLLRERQGARKELFVLITSNRGLCGSYNSAVISAGSRKLEELAKESCEVELHVAGKRGASAMKAHKHPIAATYTDLDYLPPLSRVSVLAEEFMQKFLSGQISGVQVAYMQYRSASQQAPTIARILPLSHLDLPASEVAPGSGGGSEYYPSTTEILEQLLPATVRLRLWQCFLDASASEQVMRVASMRAASDNADDIIHDLTIKYNRTRQSQITSELAEIMGGRAALE